MRDITVDPKITDALVARWPVTEETEVVLVPMSTRTYLVVSEDVDRRPVLLTKHHLTGRWNMDRAGTADVFDAVAHPCGDPIHAAIRPNNTIKYWTD